MKKRLFVLILMLILGVTLLASCGEEEAPEGLSAVSTSNPDGIKFYCPEGWTVVSDSYNSEYRVYAAKMMGRSINSVTFTEAPMPEGDLSLYFAQSLANAPEEIKSSLTPSTPTLEAELFGNAKEAYKVIYSYKYTDKDYNKGGYKTYDITCLQYLIKQDGRFYIFTYTAYGTPEDEASDYRRYLDAIYLSAKHFEFTGKRTESADTPAGGDNFVLVSDKTLCGFELYLPEKYTVISSNGDIEAKISDGASLTLTRTNDAGINFFQYIDVRKAELQRIVGDITDLGVISSADYKRNEDLVKYIDGEGEGSWSIDVKPEIDTNLALGDLENIAVAYKYEYTFGGVTYRVYQLLGMTSRTGYSFTYTAPADEYDSHFDTIEEIIKRVEFK